MAKNEKKDELKDEILEEKDAEKKDELEDETPKAKADSKKEKTCKVRIPIDPLNPKDNFVIVGINGVYTKVERGKDGVEVTEPVYEQLKNAGLV